MIRALPALFLAVLWAGGAAAQEAPQGAAPDTDQAAEEAMAHFEEGVRLFRQEDYAGALEQFRMSFDARPTAALRYNIGVCHYDLGRAVDARRELALYLADMDPARVSEERRQEVQGILAELDATLALLDVRIPDTGARVTVDNVDMGVSPLRVPVAVVPGEHDLRVTLGDQTLFVERVTVVAGERRTIVVATAPAPPPPPPLLFPPELPGPPGVVPAPIGARGEETPPEEGLSPVWFWTSVATAGALAVAGTVTGALVEKGLGDFNDAANRCNGGDPNACDEGWSVGSDVEDLGVATTTLFILAGAAACAALTLSFFTDFDGERPARPAVVVGAGPLTGAAGNALGGIFIDAAVTF